MFFLIGWGGSSKVLGDGFNLDCPNCHNSRTWRVIQTGRKATVFFVPVANWNTRYWMACPICSAAVELESCEQAQDVLASALQQNGVLQAEVIKRLGKASGTA